MTHIPTDESSIAAGVVLYYPDKDLIGNIKTYISSVNKVFIFDNSDEPLEWVKEEFSGNPKVSFLPAEGNRGIAEALNKCCAAAANENHLWILTMDQDSGVINPLFFEEFHKAAKDEHAGIFAASYSLPANPGNTFFVEATEVITSGNLVNLKAWERISGFNGELFIDEVDHDFCARLTLKGYKIYTTNQVFLDHHLGNNFSVFHKGRNQQITLTKHAPIRIYYISRNTLYLLKTYFFSNRKLATTRFRELIVKLYQIYRFYPDRKSYYSFIRRGVFDFMRGKYGKYK